MDDAIFEANESKLGTIHEDTVISKMKSKPLPLQYGDKPRLHKPSKYHYHLKVDRIYGDKTLKLCGQCMLPNNLAKDLRFLDRNMTRVQLYSEGSMMPANSNSMSLPSSPSSSSHREQKQFKLEKFETKDLIDLHKSFDNPNKMNIEFDVIDLTSERQSGPCLPIITLPDDLFKFTQLKRLHLDCNQIKVIPDQLGTNLANLETLTMSNNCLKELPNSLENLKKLSSLHLSSNKFEKFPHVLCRIESLRFLDLCSNEIKVIEPELSSMKNLESLLLFHNCIRELPPQISQLVKLRTLWLGENKLTKLPREIVQLINLDWNDYISCNIDRNPLMDPPVEICSKGLDAIIDYFKCEIE